jgi:hypothetical protein
MQHSLTDILTGGRLPEAVLNRGEYAKQQLLLLHSQSPQSQYAAPAPPDAASCSAFPVAAAGADEDRDSEGAAGEGWKKNVEEGAGSMGSELPGCEPRCQPRASDSCVRDMLGRSWAPKARSWYRPACMHAAAAALVVAHLDTIGNFIPAAHHSGGVLLTNWHHGGICMLCGSLWNVCLCMGWCTRHTAEGALLLLLLLLLLLC